MVSLKELSASVKVTPKLLPLLRTFFFQIVRTLTAKRLFFISGYRRNCRERPSKVGTAKAKRHANMKKWRENHDHVVMFAVCLCRKRHPHVSGKPPPTPPLT